MSKKECIKSNFATGNGIWQISGSGDYDSVKILTLLIGRASSSCKMLGAQEK
jgi:hypothetical protein